MKPNWKKLLKHAVCVAVMLIAACVYFSPVFEGKTLQQGDQVSARAMTHETVEYAKQTGEHVDWLSSMFSGMPSHQTRAGSRNPNFITQCVLAVGSFNSIDLGVFLFYMLSFYIALVCLGVSPMLALLGALGFGLGSYNLILIHAGHITKARAVAFILPVFVGMLLCFKACRQKAKTGKVDKTMLVWGSIMFTLSVVLEVSFNHIQITYYALLGALIVGVVYFVYACKEKWLGQFFIAVAVFVVAAVFALACNARILFVTQDYSKYTMRGGSEITVTPDDLYGDGTQTERQASSGLNIDYAYSWSYGIGETYTLLVPGAYGGGSSEKVGHTSASYKNFRQDRMPLYWGDQPFTEGPVYFGAIVIFLFIFGLFVVKGPERWWLLLATILSIMLAWGRNFMPLNEWLFYHLPFYNKFRTPSMSLVLANVTTVFMAVLALKAMIDNKQNGNTEKRRFNIALYVSAAITVAVLLLGLALHGGLSYSGSSDQQMAAQYGNQWSAIQDILIQDRQSLFVRDSWRSLAFVVLAFVIMWTYINGIAKKTWITLVPLTLLVVIDLWGVDRRYISNDSFVKRRNLDFRPADYDQAIDRLANQYGDKDYRVLNLAVNTFNDATPSVFHHQIGGYSAIKLRRYQDIIDFYISRRINPQVLAMLNTRYIVSADRQVHRNPDALGNCWFVDNYALVPDPNAEILALNDIDPAVTAVIDSSQWAAMLAGLGSASADVSASASSDDSIGAGIRQLRELQGDSTATIEEVVQSPYNPGYLKYKSHSATDRLAVFSEVYYKPDWFAYIDGKPADYLRANYILRAMIVPAGDHIIEFRNEAPLVHRLNRVTLYSQIVLLLAIAACITLLYRKRRQQQAG